MHILPVTTAGQSVFINQPLKCRKTIFKSNKTIIPFLQSPPMKRRFDDVSLKEMGLIQHFFQLVRNGLVEI